MIPRRPNPMRVEREYKVLKDLVILKMEKEGFRLTSEGGENIYKKFLQFEDQAGHSITVKLEYNERFRKFIYPNLAILTDLK
jgi:hypothetical protein